MTQEQALNILKTGANVFLTGEPGAGKTYVINAYVAYLRERGVDPAVTASTGLAATHLGGVTIHSWSGIGIKKTMRRRELTDLAGKEYLHKRLNRARVLIIDEISMLHADTLTMVDAVCRHVRQSQEPFGGLQTILVGDFFQLPPIVKSVAKTQDKLLDDYVLRFAYDSPAWSRLKPIVCYLTEQHRQDDPAFGELLGAIRQQTLTDEHAALLTARRVTAAKLGHDIPKLYTHNADVDRVNDEILAGLPGDARTFEMKTKGKSSQVDSLIKSCLSPEILQLKKDATVIFTKNSPRHGFVNGSLGKVVDFDKETNLPRVKLTGRHTVTVEPMDWLVEEHGSVKARLTQLPLRLAWAITVHKSQGMSLDAAAMDLTQVFEYGQGYVALSRVRRLDGLYLLGWSGRALEVHPEVFRQDKIFRAHSDKTSQEFDTVTGREYQKLHTDFLLAIQPRQ